MKLMFAPGSLPRPKAELPDMFNPKGFSAEAIADRFLWIVVPVCGGIFLIVCAMVMYALIKNRARGDETGHGKLIYGNFKLETFWTAIPLVIVGCLIALSIVTAEKSDPEVDKREFIKAAAGPDAPRDAAALRALGDEAFDIIARGHQWWWEFQYPKHGVWTAAEMHIPANKRLLIRVSSADVIHDFWVPQLSRKIDAIPGWDNHIWVEANEPGWYHGICAEYCGNQHAWMRFDVVAESQADFDAWVTNQKEDAPKPQTQLEKEGYALFANNTCGDCHTVKGTGFDKTIGPDLTHLMTRKYLGSGVLELNDDTLFAWMMNAQAVKPGCNMPDFRFTGEEVMKITAYLESLK